MRVVVIPGVVEPWEAVASLAVLQSQKEGSLVATTSEAYRWLAERAGFLPQQPETVAVPDMTFEYNEAYRAVDRAKEQESYFDILARANGLTLPGLGVKFTLTGIPVTEDYIVIAPHEFKREHALTDAVWIACIRYLKKLTRCSQSILLLGDRGKRLDAAHLTEAELVTDLPFKEQVELVARAKLVIGVPNALTWLAAMAWHKTMVVLVPEATPVCRYWPFYEKQFGVGVYDPKNLQTPIVLASLRRLMGMVEAKI